jgi:hypothetical protein
MRKQLTNLSIHQTSKIIAILYFLLAVIITIPTSIILYIQLQDPTFFLFLIYPFFMLIMTYISTAILAWFYNLVAKSFGGIEFKLEDQDQ